MKTLSMTGLSRLCPQGLVAAFAVAPLCAAPPTVHAAAVRYAQAYTRRSHTGRRIHTYSGVVTRNFKGSQFELALLRGGTLRVDGSNVARGGFRVGNRVSVTGRYNADQTLFIATSVSVTSSRALHR